MNSVKSILVLADCKISEAECLFANGHYDAAYYIAGYAVEMLLKAKICQTLKVENFFDFNARKKFGKNEDSITKPYKVHDFDQLLILSGLYCLHDAELSNSQDFRTDWSVINEWKEDLRYKSGNNSDNVKKFIECIKRFKQWIINQHL